MGMAAIATKCIVTIFLVYSVCCCNCQSDGNPSVCSSWTKLQISPDPFTSMEYGNFFIEIYEHTNNKKSATAASEKKIFLFTHWAVGQPKCSEYLQQDYKTARDEVPH
jgi:hypothetical protein